MQCLAIHLSSKAALMWLPESQVIMRPKTSADAEASALTLGAGLGKDLQQGGQYGKGNHGKWGIYFPPEAPGGRLKKN